MNNGFLKFVLRDDVGKIAAQRHLLSGQLVPFFFKVSEEAAFAGTATLSDDGTLREISFRRRLHNHELQCSEESGQVDIRPTKTQKQSKTLLYPYPSSSRDEAARSAGRFIYQRLLRM